MKSGQKQRERFQRIRPLDVAAYLRFHGWKKINEKEGVFSVWVQDENLEDAGDLLLPLRPDFRDYPLRIAEVLKTLAETEGRELTEILDDLATPHHDLVTIELNDSKVSLDDGREILRSARDLVRAAAHSAIHRRAVCPPQDPDQVLNFLGKIEICHFDARSLQIKSPVVPTLEGFRGESPYARQAIVTLLLALSRLGRATKQFAEQDTPPSVEGLVLAGVSSNLCSALIGLLGFARTEVVTFGVSWSSGCELRNEDLNQRVQISQDMIPWIESIGRECESFRKRAFVSSFGREREFIRPIPEGSVSLPEGLELTTVAAENLKSSVH
jgi:hypothetical protein